MSPEDLLTSPPLLIAASREIEQLCGIRVAAFVPMRRRLRRQVGIHSIGGGDRGDPT